MYGRGWTGERVQARLRAFFSAMPAAPIFAPAVNVLFPADVEKPIDGLRLVEATQRCLGRRSQRCVALLTLTRHRGLGNDIRHYCLEAGVSRATLYRRASEAAELVAKYLNAQPCLVTVFDSETRAGAS